MRIKRRRWFDSVLVPFFERSDRNSRGFSDIFFLRSVFFLPFDSAPLGCEFVRSPPNFRKRFVFFWAIDTISTRTGVARASSVEIGIGSVEAQRVESMQSGGVGGRFRTERGAERLAAENCAARMAAGVKFVPPLRIVATGEPFDVPAAEGSSTSWLSAIFVDSELRDTSSFRS